MQNNDSAKELMRIIQEIVPGKQITMAHIIASPDEIIYKKLGLDPKIDYKKSAIGIITISPSEATVIASDVALKSAGIEIGFIDRFSGTFIFTGNVSDVSIGLESILNYFKDTMGFSICQLTQS